MIEGDGGTVGPNLERIELVARLTETLTSEDCPLHIDEINKLDSEPFTNYRSARQNVLDAEGLEKVRKWIEYRIQEPRFDRTVSAMPNLGLGPDEAVIIANFLVEGHSSQRGDPLRRLFDRLSGDSIGRRDLALFLVLGGAVGSVGATMMISAIIWMTRRRRNSRSD